jgi:hypothetical protein
MATTEINRGISPYQIVNEVLPLTKDDQRCGFKKAKKLRARADLIILINDYREGKQVELPDDVLKLLQDEVYASS